MWNKEIYEAMDDEEYLFGKLTNDGGFNHLFFKEQKQPYRKKNHKPIEEKVDVPISSWWRSKRSLLQRRKTSLFQARASRWRKSSPRASWRKKRKIRL